MSILRKALLFSFADKYMTLVIEFISVMIVSRVFTPAELGIYSLAASSVVIGQMLRDFGLSLYVIKEKDLTLNKIQNCFSISLILCWVIAAIYYLCAPLLGVFFKNDGVEHLVKILAINFLLIPFGTFTLALLKRNMQFDKIMVINVVSVFVRVILLMVLIFSGLGINSLAYASVIGTLTTVLMTIPAKNWEHHRIKFNAWREISKFSSMVSGSNIITNLSFTIPEFMFGRLISIESVAFFSKGVSTLGLFNQLITSAVAPVIQPYIADLNRQKDGVDTAYYTVLNFMLAMQWPFSIFVFFFAQEVLLILFGDQWEASVLIVQCMSVMMFLSALVSFNEQFFHSLGKVKFVFIMSLFELILRVILITFFYQYGLNVVVLSFVIIIIIKLGFIFPAMVREFKLEYSVLLNLYFLNLKIAVPLGIFAYLMKYIMDFYELNTFFVVVCGFAYLFGVVALYFCLTHPISAELKRMSTNVLDKIDRK